MWNPPRGTGKESTDRFRVARERYPEPDGDVVAPCGTVQLQHHSKVSQPEFISRIRHPTQFGIHESTNRTDVGLFQVGFQQGTQLVEQRAVGSSRCVVVSARARATLGDSSAKANSAAQDAATSDAMMAITSP